MIHELLPPLRYAVTTDGLHIAYRVFEGRSPPFLSVNTPGAPSMAHRLALKAYSERYPVLFGDRAGVIFDWRGTGQSDPIRGKLTIDHLVADLDALTTAIGEPVDAGVAGRAIFPAVLHAVDHLERYRSMWISEASARAGENWQGLFNRPGWDSDYREHLRNLARNYFDISNAEALDTATRMERDVPKETWAAYLEAEKGIDLTNVLPRLTIPALVAAYRPIDYKPAAEIAALLPDARLVTEPPYTNDGSKKAAADRQLWDRYLGVRLGEPLAVTSARQSDRALPANLSQRERDVLALIARGVGNVAIAGELSLSRKTVERHVHKIYTKLNVHNRVEAANWAREHGVG